MGCLGAHWARRPSAPPTCIWTGTFTLTGAPPPWVMCSPSKSTALGQSSSVLLMNTFGWEPLSSSGVKGELTEQVAPDPSCLPRGPVGSQREALGSRRKWFSSPAIPREPAPSRPQPSRWDPGLRGCGLFSGAGHQPDGQQEWTWLILLRPASPGGAGRQLNNRSGPPGPPLDAPCAGASWAARCCEEGGSGRSGPHVIPQQTCLPGCLPLNPHNCWVR